MRRAIESASNAFEDGAAPRPFATAAAAAALLRRVPRDAAPPPTPATGPVCGHVPASCVASRRDVGGTLRRAVAVTAAAGRWSKMEARDRGRILNRAAQLLRERIPEMAARETLQTGRPVREYQLQLGRVPDWCAPGSRRHGCSEGLEPVCFF